MHGRPLIKAVADRDPQTFALFDMQDRPRDLSVEGEDAGLRIVGPGDRDFRRSRGEIERIDGIDRRPPRPGHRLDGNAGGGRGEEAPAIDLGTSRSVVVHVRPSPIVGGH